MSKLNVNPTRMVLSKMKKRLTTAKRGHKLLKDKQDELMRRFIIEARRNKELREAVEKELAMAFRAFSLANSMMNPEMMSQALTSSGQKLGVEFRLENVMSVEIPRMNFVRPGNGSQAHPYGFAQTSAELDHAVDDLSAVIERLLQLAEVEKSCQLMAAEIESTRRRVNALEYRTIPDLLDTIKYIRMKLEENERSTITRLLKVKDIISQD